MKSTKAVIELQFNWIFIIIAGALIVAFFVVIVQKQKQIADVKLSGDIQADLSTILTGSRVSRGTSSLIEIPDVTVHYDCEGYSVGALGAVNPGISFSPDTMKGTNLMMWSLEWDMPFRIDNFLFITSPQARYIFVTDNNENMDSSVFRFIYNSEDKPSFPPRTIVQNGEEQMLFNKENASWQTITTNSFPDTKNYKIRFVSKEDPSTTGHTLAIFFSDIPDDAVTAVNIIRNADSCSEDDTFDCFGTVEFYQKGTFNKRRFVKMDNFESYYLGRASVIAAVFAENPEDYNCQMRKAFKKMGFIARIYFDKVSDLQTYYTTNNNLNCQLIGTAKPPLQNIIDNAEELANTFPDDSDTEDRIKEIYDAASSLEEYNNNLQRLSCAEIY